MDIRFRVEGEAVVMTLADLVCLALTPVEEAAARDALVQAAEVRRRRLFAVAEDYERRRNGE